MHYLLSKTKETTSVQSRIGGGKPWGNTADSCHWTWLSPAQHTKTRMDKGSGMDSRRRKGVKETGKLHRLHVHLARLQSIKPD